MFLTELNADSALETPTLVSSKQNHIDVDGISDISKDERVEPSPQRSNETPAFAEQTTTQMMEDFDLFVGYSTEEIRDIYLFQEQATAELKDLGSFYESVTGQPREDHRPLQVVDRPSKTERQRRKNEKLRRKKKTREDFQHHVLRAIYPRYDYRKIRSQLVHDGIHTSHQLTINRRTSEVRIGFKSAEERQRAAQIICISYFSRQQFKKRWC